MKALIAIAVLVLILLAIFGSYVSAKNQMVTKNEAVKSTWSQVDVVLQRRADLIPNLVETVKGIAGQEQTVFGEIAKARSALLSASSPADKIAANRQLDVGLGRLLAIAENYPQLRSSENFLKLQDELAGTENRIAVERMRFNESVQQYDTAIRKFPTMLWAGVANFHPKPYFQAATGAETPPKVNFDFGKPAAPAKP